MSRVTVAMTEAAFQVLADALDRDSETGYMATLGRGEDGTRDLLLCIRELLPIPDEAYIEKARDHLVISSGGFMPAFGLAARTGAAGAFVHTHPGLHPRHSRLDDEVDKALAPVAIVRTGIGHYLSIVAGGTRSSPELSGKVVSGSGEIRRVNLFRVVGERIRLFRAGDEPDPQHPRREPFDRQIRAFGDAGQDVLSLLRVGVVGAGGTGSSVAEQLTRLGVGELTLVDDDVVTASNISRVYGSVSDDIGRPKVEVVASYLSRIRKDTRVHAVVARVTDEKTARRLRYCDVIFGCTDDQWGRSVLTRLAYWYLIPLIDLAVVITSDGNMVQEIIGRVTIIGPGSACLLCRGRIQPDAIRAESLPAEERIRLAAEGYVPGLGEPDPSVVTYTTLVAAMATSELIQRLFGFGHGPAADELLLRADHRELRRNRVEPRPGHYCASPATWGVGDADPFLGQLWT